MIRDGRYFINQTYAPGSRISPFLNALNAISRRRVASLPSSGTISTEPRDAYSAGKAVLWESGCATATSNGTIVRHIKNNYKEIIQIPKHSLKKTKISKCAPKRPRHTFQELVKSDQARARKIHKISNEGCVEIELSLIHI